MRLTNFQTESILQLAKKYFGTDAEVFLFGSRTDDTSRGGDIDLFITGVKDEENLNISNKIRFLAELKKKIGDQKIDVILDKESLRKERESFYKSILKSKQKLQLQPRDERS